MDREDKVAGIEDAIAPVAAPDGARRGRRVEAAMVALVVVR